MRPRVFFVAALAALWLGLATAGSAAAAPLALAAVDSKLSIAMPCEQLATEDFTQIPEAPSSVISSKLVKAASGMPEYCDVSGFVQPQIGFELRLPTHEWNGRYFQVGCGGLCGLINIQNCGDVLARDFAVAADNMGHVSHFWKEPLWAEDPELRRDYGGRGTHVTAVAAKAIIARLYGRQPAVSYFRGCSTGGREALFEAQHYPADFDGIIAGDPAFAARLGPINNNFNARYELHRDGTPVFPPAKLQLLASAVMNTCDALDGLKDGIIDDPRACHFDIATLACPAGVERADCLNAEQVNSAKHIYDGVRNSKGVRLFPGGEMFGSELGWDGINQQDIANAHLRYLGFAKNPSPTYTFRDFDFDRDMPKLEATTAIYDPVAPYTAPDLSKFHALGHKLIIYHGWADQGISPLFTLDYYAKIYGKADGIQKTRDWFRVFMVPGMHHCRGGDSPNTFDFMPSLVAWTEHGEAPAQVVATQAKDGKVLRTRPLVPYPQFVRYVGTGDVNVAANWSIHTPRVLTDDNIDYLWGPKKTKN
jgi:hypothetical protein